MRILMIQPNYHSGGAEIAGNGPDHSGSYRHRQQQQDQSTG